MIVIRGAREHNLKNIDVTIPHHALTVITGVSGSGKSSLAFDTLYAEGQRRYVESLSAYARQFLSLQEKPDVESIEGLSPAIAIEQKNTSKNPRSTVGTVTEVYDYLRLLFARIGQIHCHVCNRRIETQTVSQMVDTILALPEQSRLMLLAPIVVGRKGEYRKEFDEMRKQGFIKVLVDGVRYDIDELPPLDKQVKHTIEVVVDRIVVKPGQEGRLADSLETALRLTGGLARLQGIEPETFSRHLSTRHACVHCQLSFPDPEPRLFSFNNPFGACPTCDGLGTRAYFDPERVVGNPDLSLREGAITPWAKPESLRHQEVLYALAEELAIDIHLPWRELPENHRRLILTGSGTQPVKLRAGLRRGGERESRNTHPEPWEGVIPLLEQRFQEHPGDDLREALKSYRSTAPCPDCQGRRLRPEALHVRINGLDIAALTRLPLRQALDFLERLTLSPSETAIAQRILKEAKSRMNFLIAVGLDYLTLDRQAGTLSGGEGQRIRLATQIGSGLVGVLYILDEPSIGLHQRDNRRLLDTLLRLRDLGNTVVVVEHDEEAIRAADYVVDMGPGPGEHGGRVVAAGSPAEIIRHPDSLTGRFLKGEITIPMPERRRPHDPHRCIVLTRCTTHNLQGITVEIPLGLFTCVTGVSGSGKSSLILDTLLPALAVRLGGASSTAGNGRCERVTGLEHLDKVIDIDQSPIGRTPRSNPATYTGVFTPIRELFAGSLEARARGYEAGRFSFNLRGGRCEACAGEGLIRVEMHFLPDLFVKCDQCQGRRYNRETLEIRYKGLTIAEVLELTVEEAGAFFQPIMAVREKLTALLEVGLGYLRLGQAATTLSGGEAQRVKIARELARRATGRTLYILDEPTTGLHFADIRTLLEVLDKLVAAGNTVVVIEHNLEVLKRADWLIDLGPEGGEGGGHLIACGPPEAVANVPASWTGQYLKALFH